MAYIRNSDILIENGATASLRKARKDSITILDKVLKSLDPFTLIRNQVKIKDNALIIQNKRFDLGSYKNVYVVGAGKAAYKMALALESLLPFITQGHVNAPFRHANLKTSKRISFTVASHPVPDKKGVEGSKKIIEIAKKAGKEDLVIALISGGGSSLMPLPVEGITLKDKIDVTRLLLKSNATINELNAVRKHLSQIKGGLLAKYAYPATVITLILSDVIGDPLDIIASGPTVSDTSTFKDVYSILKKYALWSRIPARVKAYIENGLKDKNMETPKKKDRVFEKVHNFILCNHYRALEEAAKHGKRLGYSIVKIKRLFQGEAKKAAYDIALLASKASRNKKIKKPCLIVGAGETTVKVAGHGYGGRNQELALYASSLLKENMVLASFGTDGVDGLTPKPVAGALVDFYTKSKACRKNLDIKKFLKNNDSYAFFGRIKDHIVTGPTGTNAGDLMLVIVF